MSEVWRVFCDGGALADRLAIGAVLVAPGGEKHTLSRAIKRRGCSNEAEALAFIAALDEAALHGARRVHVTCDNSVLIEQTVGAERTRIERLARVYAQAREAISRFERVELQWVPRHKNTEADALVRAAYSNAAG